MRDIPANTDAEKFVLGSILLDDRRFASDAAASLVPADFILESHRRIFQRICGLYHREERIDRVTVAEELIQHNELESVGGITYLVSLDEGLPLLSNIDAYIGILKEKSAQRSLLAFAQNVTARVELGEKPAEILEVANNLLARLAPSGKTMRVADVKSIRTHAAQKIDWLLKGVIAAGTVILITGESGSGKSTLLSAICGAVALGTPFAGMATQRRPILVLDRENPLAVVVERFDRLDINDSPDFINWGGWEATEAPSPWSPVVVEWVRSCQPKPLIVVDSLVSFNAGDENSATETRAYMQGLRRLSDMGATVVALHHSGKADSSKEYRGSSDYKASVDVAYVVANIGPDPMKLEKVRLRAFKARFSVENEIVLNCHDGQFRMDSRGPFANTTETLIDLLRANPGITKDAFEALAKEKDLSRTRARNFLSNEHLKGRVYIEVGKSNSRFHTWAEDRKQCTL